MRRLILVFPVFYVFIIISAEIDVLFSNSIITAITVMMIVTIIT